jgi:hypothetical protein
MYGICEGQTYNYPTRAKHPLRFFEVSRIADLVGVDERQVKRLVWFHSLQRVCSWTFFHGDFILDSSQLEVLLRYLSSKNKIEVQSFKTI